MQEKEGGVGKWGRKWQACVGLRFAFRAALRCTPKTQQRYIYPCNDFHGHCNDCHGHCIGVKQVTALSQVGF